MTTAKKPISSMHLEICNIYNQIKHVGKQGHAGMVWASVIEADTIQTTSFFSVVAITISISSRLRERVRLSAT